MPMPDRKATLLTSNLTGKLTRNSASRAHECVIANPDPNCYRLEESMRGKI
jgi:hypothetical protein